MLGADGGINLHMNSKTSSHVSPSKEMALFRLVHLSLPFRWHFFHIFSMNLCCMSPLMLVLDCWKRQHRGCFLATSGWQFADFFCFFVHIRFCWQLNEHGCSNLCSNIALVKTHAIWLNDVATREHTSFGTIWHIEKTSKNSIVWTLNLSSSPQMRRWCKMEDGFPWATRRLNETLGVSDGFSGPGERFPERLLWGCEGVPSCRHGELMGNSWGTHGELVAPTTYGETSNRHDQVLEDFSSSVWTLWQILCVVQNFVSPVQFLKTALATYQRSNMHSIWLRKWPDMSVRRFVSKIWNHGNFTKRFFWQEPNNQNKNHAACHVFSSPYLPYGVYFLCCTTPNAGAGGTIGGMRTMPSKMPWQKYGGGSRPRSSPSICLSVWWKIMEYLQLKPL